MKHQTMNTPPTAEQSARLQHKLMEAFTDWKEFLRANELPSHLCLHLAPDMCHIAEEHEYQKERIGPGEFDFAVICNRLPAPCHNILVKL
jgi:hypothetical protein